jgi:hypothetical protein
MKNGQAMEGRKGRVKGNERTETEIAKWKRKGMKKRVANEMNRRKWTSGEVGMGMMGQKAIGGRGKRTWG